MSTYQLEQTGQQVQNILNEAPQTKLDLQSEIERATGKEGELAQAIADEKTRAEGIEGGLRTDLDAEIQRATDKDVVLENAIGAEETRAEGVEGALRDDVDAIDAVIPNQASSSNQLADKAFVNSSIATNTADFKGTYNSLEQLETEVTDANANDYAFVIGTDQTGNTVYNRYKYVEGTGWEFEYALNNSSFTASQWAAINSAITAALVAKLTGLPTAEALTTSFNDLLTAIGAEKTRAELIEAGLRTDVNANAGAIVTEKNRAEGVEGTLTNGLTGEIQNRSNADTALGLRIDGEATLRENADSALQGDIDAIDAKIPTQASSSNQLADKAFVNSSIATNTAEFKGTYNSLSELEAVTGANANDYGFVISTDSAGNTVYNRYKYVEGTGWVFEYALNNSSFTASQWAAINSGITAALVAKLSALPTNDALTAALSAITDVIPTAASSSNKLIDAAQFVAALATKQDTLTFDSTPTANSNNPVTSQGIKNAIDALDAAKADKATTLAGYGIEDAYTKTEVNGLVSTPHQNYVTVATYASLPASGSADTIYRVSSYDGANSQVDNTVYSEYAWNGSAYVFLCVKSQIDEVFDITVYNSNTKYADLAAALGTNGANIPQSLRRGGMSVKFVQSSDNKYIQARLMANAFTTDITKWQVVDDEPVEGSENLIGSGAVAGVCGYNMELENSSLLEVVTDPDGKMIEATKKDGTKVFYGGIESPNIDALRGDVDKIEDECGGNIQANNSEFVDVVIDSENKMIEATKKDGKKIFYGGIGSPTIDALEIELNKLNKRNLSSYCTGSGSESDAFVSSDGTAGLNKIKNTITDGGSIYLPKGKYAISAPVNINGTSILIEGESMSYTEGTLNAMVGFKGSRLSLTDEDAHLDFNVMGSEISRLGIFGVKADDYNVSYKDIFDINNIDKNCGILASGHFDQCKINKVCLSMLACGIVCKGTVSNKAMLDASIFDNINFDGCYNGLWIDADTSDWNGYMRINNCIFADMFGMPMYVPVSYAWFITNNNVMNAGGYIANDIISLTGNPTMFYINGSSNRIIDNHFYGCGQTNDAMIGGTWGEYEKIEGCYALISNGRRNTISDNTVVYAGNGFLIKNSFSIISQNNFEGIDNVPLEITGNNNLISNNQIISYNENSIIIRGNNNTIVSNVCNGKIVLYGNNNKVINNNATDIVDNGTGNVIV